MAHDRSQVCGVGRGKWRRYSLGRKRAQRWYSHHRSLSDGDHRFYARYILDINIECQKKVSGHTDSVEVSIRVKVKLAMMTDVMFSTTLDVLILGCHIHKLFIAFVATRVLEAATALITVMEITRNPRGVERNVPGARLYELGCARRASPTHSDPENCGRKDCSTPPCPTCRTCFLSVDFDNCGVVDAGTTTSFEYGSKRMSA